MLQFSVYVLGLVGFSLFLLGCLYLSLEQFMPYHAAAIQMNWSDLGPDYQGLLLGLIRGLGGGALIAGLAIMFMVRASLKLKPRPYLVLLPFVAVGYSTLLCYATYTVYARTPGDPPLLLNILLVATRVAGSIAFVASQQRAPQLRE